MNENNMPFIQREAYQKLDAILNNDVSQNVYIYGESGTGKTSLARELARKVISSKNKKNYLVASVNMVDDNITAPSFLELLIYTLWNGNVSDVENMLNISKFDSLNVFLKSKRRYRKLAKNLLLAVKSTISLIPTYGAAVSNYLSDLNDLIPNEAIVNKTDILEKYFKKICKKKKIILIVDNYQFMLPSIRSLFESSIGAIENNFTLVTIYRSQLQDIQKPHCFFSNRTSIYVGNFSKKNVDDIFIKKYGDSAYIRKISYNCYTKTAGNAKEVDLYIRRNDHDISNRIFRFGNAKTLRESLGQLPDVQRYLILLATLFPSGIKVEYVYRFVNKLFIAENQDIEHELKKLITLGYVIVNSINHDLLKPAHDRIGLNIDKIQSDEDFLDFYNSIEKTLEELIVCGVNNEDYVYFLHCLIGICSIHDLIRNINRLIELIGIKYNNCAYYYVTELIRDLDDSNEIIKCLPVYSIVQILDSCQKSSEFSLGLSIYNQWQSSSPNDAVNFKIYAIKFLTQMYDFDQALSLIDDLEKTNEIMLYKLIILQHKALNEQAKKIIDDIKKDNPLKDKWYYLILRNSAHYYSYDDAWKNLNECLNFFKTHGTIFEQATTYNNLGVIQIWNGINTFSQAEINLNEAINRHLNIQSNEIFESYCNLSVLKYLQGDYHSALKYINMALDELPMRLELDVIILTLNKLFYQLSVKQISVEILYEKLKVLKNRPIITKDPWVKFQVEYNLSNVEKNVLGKVETEYDKSFINKKCKTTGFEVFTYAQIETENLPISLSLSPNWRY